MYYRKQKLFLVKIAYFKKLMAKEFPENLNLYTLVYSLLNH